ncbi:hypothetical protein ATE92_2788 [Ulvibacter sp. MAR_2010_11]|uniref:hypothetical protein n=1 Tax=Ulvibacter sp. MAR_2010_11 TaxID=1250229 RepID=UPI000CC2F6E7|nr:hypothetical protein [Ulvibacter sp. MAR_2010_11]PKA84590.1 hypothetical protein ATE92_2788 [Ulvibacter sp. MAR_2010_11]
MRQSLWAMAITLVFLITGCQQENLVVSETENFTAPVENTQTRASGPSANGQGTLTNPDGSTRHFSFHAKEKNNGSIQGSGVLTYGGGLLKIKFDVDCLEVSGNTAHLSGIITSWSDNPDGVGWGFWFKVIDNGEGANADPDEMTRLGNSPSPLDCTVDYGIEIYQIEGGNIQVKS